MLVAPASRSRDRGAALTLGFAIAVSMWAVAYLCRLPLVMAPAWLVLWLMLAVVVGWGAFAGSRAVGWLNAVGGGALASVLNLLVLGGLLSTPGAGHGLPTVLLWVLGSTGVVASLAGVAAALAGRGRLGEVEPVDWTALLAKVCVGATFLLVVAGGLVTSAEAGLAVVDWPNTFGHTMFLYPLARMSGGVYYEHAHRLFGSLVGLCTLSLAILLVRVEPRRWVRHLAIASVILVVIQGVLGGLRVTGRLTLSTSAGDMAPSLALAAVHGVVGQLFFAMVAALAAVCSREWKRTVSPQSGQGSGEGRLHTLLLVALLTQLGIGAVQRHLAHGLTVHIAGAAVVAVLAVLAGTRVSSLRPAPPVLTRLGRLLLLGIAIQLPLGLATLAVTSGWGGTAETSTLAVTVATAHQAVGAVLLAGAVALALFARHLCAPLVNRGR